MHKYILTIGLAGLLAACDMPARDPAHDRAFEDGAFEDGAFEDGAFEDGAFESAAQGNSAATTTQLPQIARAQGLPDQGVRILRNGRFVRVYGRQNIPGFGERALSLQEAAARSFSQAVRPIAMVAPIGGVRPIPEVQPASHEGAAHIQIGGTGAASTVEPDTASPVAPIRQQQSIPADRSISQDLDYEHLEAQAAIQERAANSGEAVVHADPQNAPPVLLAAPGMSTDTGLPPDPSSAVAAVSPELSGATATRAFNEEDDRPRLAATAPVEARASFSRTAQDDINLLVYALSTRHGRGVRQWSRFGGGLLRPNGDRNCAAYASAGDAQAVFLARGGPKRDPLGMDPDGDGYACRWDPSPYRSR